MQRDGQELITGPKTPPTTRYQRSTMTTRTQNAEWWVSAQQHPGGHRIMDDMLEGLPAIQEFADAITTREWPAYRPGLMWRAVIITDDRAETGLYRSGTITVPRQVRTIVLLHELAHHFANAVQGFQIEYHDAVWVRAYLDLIEYVYGNLVAEQYRQSFVQHGVTV